MNAQLPESSARSEYTGVSSNDDNAVLIVLAKSLKFTARQQRLGRSQVCPGIARKRGYKARNDSNRCSFMRLENKNA